MNTYRRTAAVAGIAAFAAFASVASPASGATEPTDRERPCFIVQPRWNTAFDGPAPTCATPTWQASSQGPAWARFRG